MFLLERISFEGENEGREWLAKVKFSAHSPVMLDEHVWILGFEGKDKNYTLRTTRVIDIAMPHDNIIEFKTKSGAVYRITRL